MPAAMAVNRFHGSSSEVVAHLLWQNRSAKRESMRIGIIGGGVIARLVLEHIRDGALGDVQVVAIAGRSAQSKGKPLAEDFGVPFVVGLDALAATRPEAVVEAASHDAVREYARAAARARHFVRRALRRRAVRRRAARAAGAHRGAASRAALRALGRHRRPGCAEGGVPRRRRRSQHRGDQAARGLEGHSLRREARRRPGRARRRRRYCSRAARAKACRISRPT